MAARPRTLPAAIAPVLVGSAAAAWVSAEADFRWGAFIAALIGSIFIQIGTNLANDYSDAKRGADTADRLGPVRVTSAGLVRLTVTNLGYFGNGLEFPNQPSCEYPPRSHVEHVFVGGIWVGAVTADGSVRVSTGACA